MAHAELVNELDQISTVADFMALSTGHPCRFAAGLRRDTDRMNEVTLGLPRLTAGRDFAQELATVLGDVTGKTVRVDCSSVVSMSPAFAAELVKALLVERGAAAMVVLKLASLPGRSAMQQAALESGKATLLTLQPI